MTRDTAEAISQKLEASGYAHTRIIRAGGHRIELEQSRFDGRDLLALMAMLVPDGIPVPDMSVSWETSRGLVIS